MIDRLIYTQRLANELMIEHMPHLVEQGWTFKFSNTKTAVGICGHNTKTIEFSRHFVMSPDEQIRDTILHEIAHALVGPKHGHDATWRWQAMKIGAEPERCADGTEISHAKHNYILECPDCGRQWKRFRLRFNNPRCPDCKESLIVMDTRTGEVYL